MHWIVILAIFVIIGMLSLRKDIKRMNEINPPAPEEKQATDRDAKVASSYTLILVAFIILAILGLAKLN